MRIRYLPFHLALLSASLILSGNVLASTPPATASVAKAKKCVFPKSRKRAPKWVCDARADGLEVAAVGTAAKSGAGLSFMQQMAAADARTRLAGNLNGVVQKEIAARGNAANDNSATRDSALITRITDASLPGAKVIKKAYGPDGTLYVLVGVDKKGMQKLHETIAADYPQQKRK